MKIIVQHPLNLPHILYVKDAKYKRFISPRQQDHTALRSTHSVGGFRERQKYGYNFIQELSCIIQKLDHYLGDDVNEGAYNGQCDGKFDA